MAGRGANAGQERAALEHPYGNDAAHELRRCRRRWLRSTLEPAGLVFESADGAVGWSFHRS